MINSPGHPPLPKLPLLEATEKFSATGDVEPYIAPDGNAYVPVVVGHLAGYYSPTHHRVIDRYGRTYTPTGFECAGGRENNRKWRLSIRVLMPDGTRGRNLGVWLVAHNYDHLIPPTPLKGKKETPANTSTTGTAGDDGTAKGGRRSSPSPTRGRVRRRRRQLDTDDFEEDDDEDYRPRSRSPVKHRSSATVSPSPSVNGGRFSGMIMNGSTITPALATDGSRGSPTKARRTSLFQTDPNISPSNLFSAFKGAVPGGYNGDARGSTDHGVCVVGMTPERTPTRVTTPIASMPANSSEDDTDNEDEDEDDGDEDNDTYDTSNQDQVYHPPVPPPRPKNPLAPVFAFLAAEQIQRKNEEDARNEARLAAQQPTVDMPPPVAAVISHSSGSMGSLAKYLSSEEEEGFVASALEIIHAEDARAAQQAAAVRQQAMPWMTLASPSTKMSGLTLSSPGYVSRSQGVGEAKGNGSGTFHVTARAGPVSFLQPEQQQQQQKE